jgi:hypothetical protein
VRALSTVRRFSPAAAASWLATNCQPAPATLAAATVCVKAEPSRGQYAVTHSNPSITLGIYSHWFKNAKGCGAVERLAKMALGTLKSGNPVRVGSKWALERPGCA